MNGVDTIMAFSLLSAPGGNGVFLASVAGATAARPIADTINREGFEVPPLSESSMDFLRRSVPIAGVYCRNSSSTRCSDVCRCRLPVASFRTGLPRPRDFHHRRRPAHSQNGVPLSGLGRSNPLEIITFIKNRRPAKPTVFTIDSDGGDPDLAVTGTRLRAQFCKNGIPAYPSVQRAARALFHLRQYHARQTG